MVYKYLYTFDENSELLRPENSPMIKVISWIKNFNWAELKYFNLDGNIFFSPRSHLFIYVIYWEGCNFKRNDFIPKYSLILHIISIELLVFWKALMKWNQKLLMSDWLLGRLWLNFSLRLVIGYSVVSRD